MVESSCLALMQGGSTFVLNWTVDRLASGIPITLLQSTKLAWFAALHL